LRDVAKKYSQNLWDRFSTPVGSVFNACGTGFQRLWDRFSTGRGVIVDETGVDSVVCAGFPADVEAGCVHLDAAAVLRATPRSFALRVRGYSMLGAGIQEDDIVVGEFTPRAKPGAIVVALIDGESTLKRLVIHEGKPKLVSENPSFPDFVPLEELVIQGVVRMVVRRVV